MRFLLVNQFLPPDPAPTARLLGDLAAELERRGHEVVAVGDSAGYREGKARTGPRLLRETGALLRIFCRALRAPRAEAVVFLTSPPLLPAAIRWARIRHRRARFIHWVMDLYPEVAVALGEIAGGSLLHRFAEAAMASAYRNCDQVIALDGDMVARLETRGVNSAVQAPWAPAVEPTPRTRIDDEGPFTWVYSGNLGKAHEWRTVLEAQALLEADPTPVDLVFQGGGAAAEEARRFAGCLGLTRCHWHGYATEAELLDSLLGAGALLVTQRPETRGCLRPSKLTLAQLLQRPIVWVGDTTGAVAAELRTAGHGVFAPGETAALADHLRRLASSPSRSSPPNPEVAAAAVAASRKRAIAEMADRIEATASGPDKPTP